MSIFLDYTYFDEKNFQFKTPIQRIINDDTFFFIPIRHKKRDIYIKTPKIIAPHSGSRNIVNNDKKSYSYVLSFTDVDIDPKINKFLHFVQNVENFCQLSVQKNLNIWGSTHSQDSLQFRSSIKDYNNTPLFRLKITHATEIYDEKGILQNPVDIEKIVISQCHIISLIELSNIWINSSEFGLTWKVIQMKVYPPTRPIGGISLLDETPHVIENVTTIPHPPSHPPITYHPPVMNPLINCLTMITSGKLIKNKIGPPDPNKPKIMDNSLQPKIELSEILRIKSQLRSQKNDK
jgi:hypothetical protein